MRIKNLRLMNGYKRFHDLTIDLGDNPARIVALVGPNGCGKSSVLDGILFHANAYGQIGQGSSHEISYHSMNNLSNYNYQNVSIEFVEGSFEKLRSVREQTGKQNTMFSFRSPYRYNSNLKVREVRAMPEIALNDYGAKTASDLDDKVEQSYRRLYAFYNSLMEREDLKPSEAKMRIIGDLNNSIRKCLNLSISSLGNIESSQGTLFFKKPDNIRDFEFNVLSSGEKEVVDILLDLYLRRQDYDDTVFLLDEPELHINTSIQRNLLIEIDRLVGENCQIWMTTHSVGFLRALQDGMRQKCQIIQFRDNDNYGSEPYILKPMKTSASAWREVFSVALDDLAHLVSPKRIIYCEGRAEPGVLGLERGMDAKAYNNIFANQYPDTLFISSGGNTELDQRSDVAIAILGKVFPSLEVLVLKDRDMASGKVTSENDRLVYLQNNPTNHRLLKRWEIENYLLDKEVLQEYCRQNSLVFDEPEYDRLVTDIKNQNIKADINRVRNICGIKGSINADAFKIQLSKCVTEEMTVFIELLECVFKELQ